MSVRLTVPSGVGSRGVMTFGEEVPVGSIGGGVSTTSFTRADTTGTSGVEKSFKSAVLEDTYNNYMHDIMKCST